MIAPRSFRRTAMPALLAVAALPGCRVVSVEEDRALRARRGGDVDAAAEVRRLWRARAAPVLQQAARPMKELLPAIDAGLPAAGARYGRRTGEGAPWTFVGRGEGIVTAIDTSTRRGALAIALAGVPRARTVRLQIGPVVVGTAVRDALPFVAFNDYPDQLAYADVGRALTRQALAGVSASMAGVRRGTRVSFTGVFNLAAPGDDILVTPLAFGPAR